MSGRSGGAEQWLHCTQVPFPQAQLCCRQGAARNPKDSTQKSVLKGLGTMAECELPAPSSAAHCRQHAAPHPGVTPHPSRIVTAPCGDRDATRVLQAVCRPCHPPPCFPQTQPYLPHSILHLHHRLLHSTPAMGMSACHVPVAGHLVARDAAVSGEQGRAACKLPAERRRRQGGWQPPSKSGCSSSPCALLEAAAQRQALSLPESRFSCSLGALSSPVPAASWVMLWAGWEGR